MTAIKNKVLSNDLLFAGFAAFVAMSFELDNIIPMFIGCAIYSIGLLVEIHSQMRNAVSIILARKILALICLVFTMILILSFI
ncbi:MAG: hypothetical protein IJ675_04095 [Pseudobutyrivibrio sp.]|nr:hypothetical protein [Pseudobutyrivibrio sp.]